MLSLVLLVVTRMVYLGTVSERFNAAFFTRAFIESVKLGSLYALIALGYTMGYGIIRLINFAHGEVLMVGAFLRIFLFTFSPYAWPLAGVWVVFISFWFMSILQCFRAKTDELQIVPARKCFELCKPLKDRKCSSYGHWCTPPPAR
jgi:hypothetical protein